MHFCIHITIICIYLLFVYVLFLGLANIYIHAILREQAVDSAPDDPPTRPVFHLSGSDICIFANIQPANYGKEFWREMCKKMPFRLQIINADGQLEQDWSSNTNTDTGISWHDSNVWYDDYLKKTPWENWYSSRLNSPALGIDGTEYVFNGGESIVLVLPLEFQCVSLYDDIMVYYLMDRTTTYRMRGFVRGIPELTAVSVGSASQSKTASVTSEMQLASYRPDDYIIRNGWKIDVIVYVYDKDESVWIKGKILDIYYDKSGELFVIECGSTQRILPRDDPEIKPLCSK